MSKEQAIQSKITLKPLLKREIIFGLCSRSFRGEHRIHFYMLEHNKTFTNGFERITPKKCFEFVSCSDAQRFVDYEHKLYL